VAGRPAVFIDRDGTLTQEVGYVNHPQRLRLLPRSAEAIRRLNERGIAAVVVTNQAGVARGYFACVYRTSLLDHLKSVTSGWRMYNNG